jgi:hypothetical protein
MTRAKSVADIGFHSGRMFEIWVWTQSHCQLLLKSDISNVHTERIEVLFVDVARVNLPTFMDQLVIQRAPLADDESLLTSVPSQFTKSDKSMFRMHGAGWRGYVICFDVRVLSGPCELNAPSELIIPYWDSPYPSK